MFTNADAFYQSLSYVVVFVIVVALPPQQKK
jgi:hypothetical protein